MAAGSSRAGGQGPAGTQSRFRAHARQAVRARALVTYAQGGWVQDVALENIGLGGACLVVDAAQVAPSDSVMISLARAGSVTPLLLAARVVWVGPASSGSLRRSVGVAFEHGNPDAAFALYQMLLAYDPSA